MSGSSQSRRRAGLAIVVLALLAELSVLLLRGYPPAGNVVVRCRRGHLFTTIWVPGASLKALRFGWWRLQRCPACGRWSMVTPVRRADLSADELSAAAATRDVRIP